MHFKFISIILFPWSRVRVPLPVTYLQSSLLSHLVVPLQCGWRITCSCHRCFVGRLGIDDGWMVFSYSYTYRIYSH